MQNYTFKTTTIFLLSLASAVVGGFIITIVLILNANQETLMNRQTALTNQTYNRVVACLLSVPATSRTTEYINACYDKAEHDTGKTVRRYNHPSAN